MFDPWFKVFRCTQLTKEFIDFQEQFSKGGVTCKGHHNLHNLSSSSKILEKAWSLLVNFFKKILTVMITSLL